MDYGLALFLRSKDVKVESVQEQKRCRRTNNPVGIHECALRLPITDHMCLSAFLQPTKAAQRCCSTEATFRIIFCNPISGLYTPRITFPNYKSNISNMVQNCKRQSYIEGSSGCGRTYKREKGATTALDGIPTLPHFWSLCFASLSFFPLGGRYFSLFCLLSYCRKSSVCPSHIFGVFFLLLLLPS